MSPALLDQLLPRPQFAERHRIDIAAPPEAVWRAIDRVEFGDLPVARLLIAARSVIGRLRNGGGSPRDVPTPDSFRPLARRDGEQVVYGLVGRWWTFGAEPNRSDVDSVEKFAGFAEPGYAKATFGFVLEPGPRGGTRLVTETRVVTTSESAYRSMRRYWPLIRPFSGLIRRLLLRAIRREATR